MRELRTIPLPLPPAGEGEWGAVQLPWPMTAEQWQAFEAYLPILKTGFVRQPAPTEAGADAGPALATQPDATKPEGEG